MRPTYRTSSTRSAGALPAPSLCSVVVRGVRVTAEVARRFLVARHLLAPARSLAGGSDAVHEFLRGSARFDPIAVAGRSHDLVLHARVADYDPAWCDSLYERRKIFEAVNKGLSFVVTSEYSMVPRTVESTPPAGTPGAYAAGCPRGDYVVASACACGVGRKPRPA
jgi:hypothetical protein